MGQYRHVSDLAAFARDLKLLPDFYLRRSAELAPLPEPVRPGHKQHLAHPGVLAHRVGLGELEHAQPRRRAKQPLALLTPVPAEWERESAGAPEVGHKLSSDGKPVIEWSILLRAARHAFTSGYALQELDDHPGEYVEVDIEGDLDLVAFDDAFEAARERGDVVVRGSALYIRLFGSPALN